MPPAKAVPRDHGGSTIPNTLGGNTIIAIIISVIITVIAIGWLAYCFYTRHVGLGVSVDKDHPNNVEAGDGYIAVYTPKYTREGYKRPRRDPPPPRRVGPRRIVVHHVPVKEHRYRMVRVPPKQEAQGAGSPQAKKQEGKQNKSNAQQQQKQQNQNQGKKKQKGKKNKQKNNNNQNNQGNNQNWQGDSQDKSNDQDNQNNNNQGWGGNQDQDPGWGPAQTEDAPQAEEDAQQENAAWASGGWNQGDQNESDQEGNGQGSWGQQYEQNESTNWGNDQVPNSPLAGPIHCPGSIPGSWQDGAQSDSGWNLNSHKKGSSEKKKKKKDGKGAINEQIGWQE